MANVIIDGVRYVPEPPKLRRGYTLGTILANFRRWHDLSLDELQIKTGISRTYLWELEGGKATDPSFKVIVTLARVLGIELDLLAESVPPKEAEPDKGYP